MLKLVGVDLTAHVTVPQRHHRVLRTGAVTGAPGGAVLRKCGPTPQPGIPPPLRRTAMKMNMNMTISTGQGKAHPVSIIDSSTSIL
ncbi:MAG: hypothetical protein NVSMB60_18930 [Mycobacterium sp.]